MALSLGNTPLIFKVCATSLLLDFCSATVRWLQLNGYIFSLKGIHVCKRKGETIDIALLKTNKETIIYQTTTSEEQLFFILNFKKTEMYA